MTAAILPERLLALPDLGERLSALRLADVSALAAMRASLEQYGQLSPVRAFVRDGAVELFDGFKRLRAARALGLVGLRAVLSEVDVIAATAQMRELHAGRGLTALEEGWIVRSLYREHRESQGAIAARLRCHKSWVCRRLMLVEALDTSVQADVRLGLLLPRSAVVVAALPRGNQAAAAAVAIRRGLTVEQTTLLVRELVDAAEPDAQQAVLARWSEGLRPGRRGGHGRTARGSAETAAVDIATLERSAGRLQAYLATTPLRAMGPPADILGKSLGELDGVLRALSQTIAGVLSQASVA